MSLLADAVYVYLKDVAVSHVKELADGLISIGRNVAKLIVLEEECYSIRIVLVVLISDHLQWRADLKLAKGHAAIPVGEPCDVAVKEMLPLFCLLFHNAKGLIVNYDCKDIVDLC